MSEEYSFDILSMGLDCIKSSRDLREQLMQYNLDETLKVAKFRIVGASISNYSTNSEYEAILQAFLSNSTVLNSLEATGDANLPVSLKSSPIGLNITTLDFFDRLSNFDIVGFGGKIRGCFDETFDGIIVGDKLREMLLNVDSENSSVYSDSEKQELIFRLFRILAIGGALCQPEDSIEKYLSLTKSIYKEIVTVYKSGESGDIKVSGQGFAVSAVDGVDLFPENSSSPHNVCLVVIDPMKKIITVIKNTYKNFW